MEKYGKIYPAIEDGGWVHFEYMGEGIFNIRVYDCDQREIDYPSLDRTIITKSVDLTAYWRDFYAEFNIPSQRGYDFQCKKILTQSQINNYLVMSSLPIFHFNP